MDFFIGINLTLLFQLLPFYVNDNEELVKMAANRSIKDRHKGVGDLEATINQVIN